jgi:hypothetical protein
MVPSVKHLHGEPVALSDPSDQDFIRSRLCRAQWPSRKVGRAGMPGGSKKKARFFKLSQQPAFICDLAHRRPKKSCRRTPTANRSRKLGIIIQQRFLHIPTIGGQPYQGLIGNTAFACRHPPKRLARDPPRPCNTTPIRQYSIVKQGKLPTPRFAVRGQKDTKPKGFTT